MANLGEETKVSGVFGGVEINNNTQENPVENAGQINGVYGGVANNQGNNNNINVGEQLPQKQGFWSKFRAFWLQEVKFDFKSNQKNIETNVENNVNDCSQQKTTWEKVHDFLFQEITFGKNK